MMTHQKSAKNEFLDLLALSVAQASRRNTVIMFYGLPISPRLFDAPLPVLLDLATLIYDNRIVAASRLLAAQPFGAAQR
jgi:hypothetical protein